MAGPLSSERANDYLGGDVARLVADARAEFGGKWFSDVIDDEGNQYVDLVLGGGGVLGIALVGYTYLLEEVGIRFLHLGGTSAGSINTILLAALNGSGTGVPLQEKKSGRMIDILAALDIGTFVDGGAGMQDLIDAYVAGQDVLWRPIELIQAVQNLGHLGLNPGDAFHQWLRKILDAEGVSTMSELQTKRNQQPGGLRLRDGSPVPATLGDLARLSIVAADVTTQTKVEFPKMAPLYWAEPEKVHPADFVRASMSIPFFFRPFVVKDIPKEPSRQLADDWHAWAGYDIGAQGEFLPNECVFIDGGIMSNFPIDLFHDTTRVPSRPTFGVKLGHDSRLTEPIEQVGTLAGAVFNSARHTLDYDFLARNPDFQSLVEYVNTDGFNWLDFHMAEDRKKELFYRGTKAAQSFLRKFDWAKYKRLRSLLAEANRFNRGLTPSAGDGKATQAASAN